METGMPQGSEFCGIPASGRATVPRVVILI